MIISGIRANESFYNYNSIKSNEVASVAAVDQQDSQEQQLTQQEAASVSVPASYQQPAQNITAFDFAQQYDAEATYEMKGADSDPASLDVTTAISQMHRDQMLQQYQFFIGNQAALTEETGAGVRPVENFVL